ncbi:Hairy/enhancer-of-split with YRPW motif protein 2 [Cryptotrichosporon argae]
MASLAHKGGESERCSEAQYNMADKSHPSAKAPQRTMLNLGNLPPKLKTSDIKAAAAQYPRTPSRVNPNQPPWPAYRGYHEYSFAHATMGVRLPTILGKAINDVYATLNQEYDEDRIVDLVNCIHRMEDLMGDLQGNSKLRPIIDDGAGDIALWNKEIAKFFKGKDFMNAPWLFAEAYKYRRLRECFSLSKYWVEYDVFFRQKCDTFSRSSQAVFELSSRFSTPHKFEAGLSDEAKAEKNKLIFLELTQICLWGNSTDLSLLIDMTEEDIKKLQSTGGEHLAATEKNILGNDLHKLADYVLTVKGGRIDFVLDNAGFELYCDLVYADWLIQSGICSQVVFHGKKIPWFVSDVTKKDWAWLLNTAVYGNLFPDASDSDMDSLRTMGNRWKQYEREGKWKYQAHPFWCTGYTFWDLHSEAPDLFQYLGESDLVIFKGDLNHRKLTYDCHAPLDTPFPLAIGPLASEPNAPKVCSLRTIKSDVVVGIPPGVGERLDEEEPGWKISGKYAVVLLSNPTQSSQ